MMYKDIVKLLGVVTSHPFWKNILSLVQFCSSGIHEGGPHRLFWKCDFIRELTSSWHFGEEGGV